VGFPFVVRAARDSSVGFRVVTPFRGQEEYEDELVILKTESPSHFMREKGPGA